MLLTLTAKRNYTKKGTETDLYKDGVFYCTIPYSQKQPQLRQKEITLNCYQWNLKFESKTTLNSKPVYIDKKWSIEVMPKKTEIVVCDGWHCYYAYISKDKSTLVWDNFYPVPQYIRDKALKLAQKYIKSIYSL